MHADTQQLLKLRDGEPVVADVREHVAGCAACGAELQRLAAVRRALGGLPQLEPPAAAWQAIAQRLERPRSRRLVPAALAAAVVLAALAVWRIGPAPDAALPGPEPTARLAGAAIPAREPPVSALVDESRRLEQLLRAIDREAPRVMSARTAGTIAGLEDSIAMIDYGLTRDESGDAAASHALWNQRVALMNTLVQVRGAQVHQLAN